MSECKKIRRSFVIVLVWTAFVLFTLCGSITAYNRTAYISFKQENRVLHWSDFAADNLQFSVNAS